MRRIAPSAIALASVAVLSVATLAFLTLGCGGSGGGVEAGGDGDLVPKLRDRRSSLKRASASCASLMRS